MRNKFCAAATLAMTLSPAFAEDSSDPYLWLEEVESEKSLDWVRENNARSKEELEGNSAFEGLYKDALSILTSDARLATGAVHNGAVYNFWQDETHVRGLWRRASVESYRSQKSGDAPDWEVLIDFDELAADEGENWIRGDVACLSPEYRHCMVELSHGGKDAAVWREFDTSTKTFVENGFYLPEAKSYLDWLDKDTLLVGTDWGDGSLTDSGYPREVRKWRRGETAAEANSLMTVDTEDVWLFPIAAHDGDIVHQMLLRGPSFFEREYHIRNSEGDFEILPTPLNADLQGVLDGQAIFMLRENWEFNGATYPQGAVVAYGLDDGAVETVMTATANQSIETIGVGKSNIVIAYLEDVAGKAVRVKRDKKGKWKQKAIKLPQNGVVSLVSAGGGTDDALFSFESLTTPETLYFVSAKNKVEKLDETPEFYDASDVVVEQRFTISSDGTKIPYFVMGKDAVLKKGDAPTVQYAYGGFLAATLPVYYSDPGRPQHGALAGKMWVERGGVLVLSNIRGGSEYGPRWHEAGLKENRQLVFDDFIAISEDLIATGVTSADKLGAVGRSNGGLLMGAILTQRPDLYAALDIGVPLFDMKRYNKLLAGASWMGEYGNPDIEEEWAYISEYSPYQKLVADAGYPKVLFYTSTKDDRVHPGHARKAAAKMADLGYDYFYYENIEGGHGGTANQDQLAYRTALEYVYFVHMLMDGQAGDD